MSEQKLRYRLLWLDSLAELEAKVNALEAEGYRLIQFQPFAEPEWDETYPPTQQGSRTTFCAAMELEPVLRRLEKPLAARRQMGHDKIVIADDFDSAGEIVYPARGEG